MTTVVVQRFLDLAKDTHTHCHLLSTELLSGLVKFLSHEDEQVIEIASECLKLLALEKPNHQVLYAQPTLVSVLTRLTGSTHQTTKRNAISAMRCLNMYAAQEDTENIQSSSSSSSSNNNTISSNNKYSSKPAREEKKKKRKRTRTYAFSINGGLEDERLVEDIQSRLVRVEGITSLTIDQNKNQVLISCKQSKKDGTKLTLVVIKQLRKAGATATLLGQVGKKKSKRAAAAAAAAAAAMPQLEEADEQDDEEGYVDDTEVYGEGILSRFGSNSLQARLADQRRKEIEMANQKSAVTSVAAAAGSAVLAAASWFGY